MKKLYQKIADEILEYSQKQGLAAGDKLPPERELAKHFKVSRSVVREAIIALEISGYLEVKPNSGAQLLQRSEQSDNFHDFDIGAFELLEARVLIEPETARLAAAHASPEDVEEMSSALEQIRRHEVNSELSEKADRRFHIAIARSSKNSALSSIVEYLWDVRENSKFCNEILRQSFEAAGPDPRFEEHTAVFKAIQDKNPEAAKAAMHTHLTRVLMHLLKTTEAETLAQANQKLEQNRRRYGSYCKSATGKS